MQNKLLQSLKRASQWVGWWSGSNHVMWHSWMTHLHLRALKPCPYFSLPLPISALLLPLPWAIQSNNLNTTLTIALFFLLAFGHPDSFGHMWTKGLFVSTEANIATCSHWWLPSLNSTTILETPVWKHSNPTCPHLSLVGDFHAILPSVYILRFTFVTKQNWVCCLLVSLLLSLVILVWWQEHWYSSSNSGLGKLDSNSDLSRPYHLGRIFPEPSFLEEKVEIYDLQIPSSSNTLWFCKEYHVF